MENERGGRGDDSPPTCLSLLLSKGRKLGKGSSKESRNRPSTRETFDNPLSSLPPQLSPFFHPLLEPRPIARSTIYSKCIATRVPAPLHPPPHLSLSSSPIELARIRFRKPEISIYASLEIKRTAGSRKKILFLFVCLQTRHEGFVNWAKLMCGE